MPFREALTRLALRDARRFERETARMLRQLLDQCEDPRTRKVVEEIISEEEEHLGRLKREDAARPASTAAPPEPLPKPPGPELPPGSLCDKLRAVLKKEEGAALFYELLAKRTPFPAIRDAFRAIAAQEKGHADKLTAHIQEICRADQEEA